MVEHRRAVRMAYWNGALWAIGNGLASSPLVLYLVMEYRVSGLGVGIALVLAAPHLVGLLRLAVPLVMDRCGGRKPFCLATCLLSGLALLGLPVAAAGGRLSAGRSLAALILLWCACQLLEYLSLVALWSWLADLVPRPVRGHFIGRRECWMAAGQAAAMLASGLFMWGWTRMHPERRAGSAMP